MQIKKVVRENWLIIVTIAFGTFLRVYHPLQLFQYSHDNDLAGWFVRDVLINHHLRLIGQETSSHGIFIGPYFYYLQIPFYLLTRLDPSGSLLLPIILGAFAIYSTYFVLNRIFGAKTALIGALFYGLSTLIIFTDREVVPTMPVMLWSTWFLYSLWLIMNGKKFAYLIIGVLVGLIWSINLQLVILLPLALLAQILSGKKVKYKELIFGVLVALVLNIPFVAFEIRHGFQQTRALVSSLTTNKDYVAGTAMGFIPKLDRTMQLVYKNSINLFSLNFLNIDPKLIFWVLVVSLVILIWKNKLNLKFGTILFLWLTIYILFFSKVSLNISEYYLNGMNIIFILVAALTINEIIQSKNRIFGFIGCSFVLLFVGLSLYSYITRPVNANGYIERKAVISYIKNDAMKHNYPCISLSFITSPGNDLGYRYFTWEVGLKTKPISVKVPVYSIVFPLSMVDGFNKSFGALGVINPDYKRYNDKTIQEACGGADYTTSQPMFGFTQ